MNAIAILLLLLSLPDPLTTLVLRSGERLDVEGKVRQDNGVVVFRAAGQLYSVPLDEVDVEASRSASEPKPVVVAPPPPKRKAAPRLSEAERKRLIDELEQNHAGVPASPRQTTITPPAPAAPEEARRVKMEEWEWRRQARSHEETIRRAQENVAMLRKDMERLRGEIATLLSLGFKPSQFSYQTSRLQMLTEQIPWADLEVQRAERLYAEFREDARKQDILPGWLR
jgi:hypothetical protein